MSSTEPRLVRGVAEMQAWSRRARAEGLRLGLVPTMGRLHEGHLSLIRIARRRGDRVIVSLFVNPAQFGPGEDYEDYPRNLDEDLALLREEDVAICFAPSVEEIYPHGPGDTVKLAGGTDLLCGASRPGHFDGVMAVVARLYNAVLPDLAVYGQKDAQQALLIRRMSKSLLFPVEHVLGPIAREADGLAMSSRNEYLSPVERRRARALHSALEATGAALRAGERDAVALSLQGLEALASAPGVEAEYFATVDPATLRAPERLEGGLLLVACAARVGATRLIDNHVYRIEGKEISESLLF